MNPARQRLFALARIFLLAGIGAGTAVAQPLVEEPVQTVAAAPEGGLLRWLDKVSGVVSDLTLAPGASALVGRLTVTLHECRYPVEDPASNAFAHLTITDRPDEAPVFDGWMIADSPALSALDHPRYDVWLLHCNTSTGAGTAP